MTAATRRRWLGGAVAASAAASLPWPAAAQLEVDITGGRREPTPIAVSPFAGDSLGAQLAEVVANDLDGSGLFKTIDPGAYIQSADELRSGTPRFADWRQINAQALVTGTLANGPGGLAVEFRLWDVLAGAQLTGLRLDAPPALWRRLAHKVADAVYARLTGEGGYFDTKIAYIAQSGPAKRLVKRAAIMDQDGANHAFVTDGRSLVLTPRFSPDTRQLAYLAYRSVRPNVVLRNLGTGREEQVGALNGITFSPRFSPDGRTLLYTSAEDGNSDIFAFDLGSGRSRRLVDGAGIDTSPSFSPDGRQFVFNTDRSGEPQLFVAGTGGGERRISFGAGRYGSPAWSPKGDQIAFTKQQGGFFHIGVMRPDGSDERLVTRSYSDQGPAWAPNGRVILFSRADRGARSRLMSIDVNGFNERGVSTPLDASDPDWSALLP